MPEKEDWIDSKKLKHLFIGLYSSISTVFAERFIEKIKRLLRKKRGEDKEKGFDEGFDCGESAVRDIGDSISDLHAIRIRKDEELEQFKKREGIE